MTIFITGVGGLIGSNLAHWLIQNTSHTIVGIDDFSGGYVEHTPELSDRFHLRTFDLNNHEVLNHNFNYYKPDIVYHFAAYAAEGLSPFIRRYNYQNNVIVTANIINACIKYKPKRLVFTSSNAVYGNGKPPFSEGDEVAPVDPYGCAKVCCEWDIKIMGEQHGIDWCIIRPHNVYGIRQNIWDSYRNVIGIFMYKALNNEPITVYGDGKQKRAFSDIRDMLKPLYVAGVSEAASKQIINLGGVKEHTINEVANYIAVLSGAEIIYLPPRHEVKNAYPTHEKSEQLLHFKHTIGLYEGIRDMWAWAQRQPKRKRQILDKYEITEGLYEYWKPENLKAKAIPA